MHRQCRIRVDSLMRIEKYSLKVHKCLRKHRFHSSSSNNKFKIKTSRIKKIQLLFQYNNKPSLQQWTKTNTERSQMISKLMVSINSNRLSYHLHMMIDQDNSNKYPNYNKWNNNNNQHLLHLFQLFLLIWVQWMIKKHHRLSHKYPKYNRFQTRRIFKESAIVLFTVIWRIHLSYNIHSMLLPNQEDSKKSKIWLSSSSIFQRVSHLLRLRACNICKNHSNKLKSKCKDNANILS